jgi:zinc D-Ala-D-Ala dipeptidase
MVEVTKAEVVFMKYIKQKAISLILITLFIFIVHTLTPGTCFPESNIPAGFVDVQKVIPSIILDIRYFDSHNFVGNKIEGYNAPKCFLTEKAAVALSKIQEELKGFSLSLKVYDCYRPQRAVNHFVRWAKDINDTKTKEEFYPTIDKKNLFKDGYIAAKSSHSRGSTVDLTIVPLPVPEEEVYIPGQKLKSCFVSVDKRFKDNSIDMGTGFDCFHELSHPENINIGLQQRINRLLLKTIMEKQGFKNYDKEWWHFTLKDEPVPNTYFDFIID